MKRKNTRGIPKFAYGGQVGDEILDFQRQYNPFLGDLPTYGMVGSQQPGAWMFFDDAWLRSGIPQPPPSAVVAPPSPPVMGDTYEGPDGGGADRYQDDWRGYGYGVTPTDFLGTAADYSNLESFAGYNTPGERVIDGPTALIGQAAGFGPVEFADEVGMMADRAAEELALGERAMTRAHEFDEPAAPTGYSRAGTGTQEISGRAWAGNRDRVDEFGPGYGVYNDLTPAANTAFGALAELYGNLSKSFSGTESPPSDYVSDYTPPEPPAYSAPSEEEMSRAGTGTMMGGPSLGLSFDFNKGTVSVDPSTIGGFFGNIGSQMGPSDRLAISDYLSDKTAGMGFGGSAPNFGEAGKVGAAALDALVSAMPPGEKFGEKATESFQTGQQGSGTAKQAAAALGAPTGAPIGLGGLFGGVASPGTPAGGAAAALADLYGLMPNDEYGFMAGALAQPQEPTNTVPGVATPGAPVGISAPAMDPLAGLTDQQIEALAAGYHDQAPAVGAPSPIAGFETGLAAAQAAAEHKGRGAEVVGAGSSGGYGAGRGMPGVEYTGSSGLVGDKQGAAGETGQGTGDNSGGGQTGNDSFGGTDSSGNSSDGGSGTDGDDGSGDSGASGTSGGSGDEGGVGAWARGGRVKSRGLPSMADQVRRAGRGNDTVLAHITPNEAARFDAMQGGPSFNPETGLREYGFLDDIGDFFGDAAKAVAPIAGGLLGGAFGGPLGAAAGAALGTALTGGSLQQSLLSGAIGGIGAYAGPKISGAAQGMFGGGEEVVGSSGGDMLHSGGGTDDLGGGGFFSNFAGNPLAMVGLGAAGGLGAGYLMGGGAGDDDAQSSYQRPTPWVPRPGGLGQRNYQPYQGDYTTYGQVGGGAGHSFYDRVNPPVEYYAEGGRVEPKTPSKERMREVLGRELMDGDDYTNPMAVLQTAQMAMPPKPAQQTMGLPGPQMQEPQQLQAPTPPTGQGMMGQWQQGAMPPWLIDRDDQGDDRVANLIWKNSGGYIKGPGDGQSDDIPAMLSNNEYVVPADVSVALGTGDPDKGADQLDRLVRNVRRHRNSGGTGLPPRARDPLDYMGR